MNLRKRNSMLVALLLGTALIGAGCNQRAPSDTTVGQKVDRAADKIAAATDNAMNKTAAVMDDSAITAKVKAALIAEPGLRSMQIDVDTKDAVVTLTGTVATEPAKERAKEVAATVAGVRSVNDNLVTKASQSG